jgi:hypothetical protein
MSINRYMLVGKDSNKLFERISKYSVTRVLTFSFLVSALLSSVVYFQMEFFLNNYTGTNLQFIVDLDNAYQSIINYDYNMNMMGELITRYTSRINFMLAITIIHDLFSYFLFCILSTLIDIVTIRKLRKALEEKKRMSTRDISDEVNKSEIKSIIMVVLNSISNFLFRMPEMVSVALFAIFLNTSYIFKQLCYDNQQCLSFNDLANVFYIFSLSLLFVFNYFFNKSFKFSFKCMTSRKPKEANVLPK